MYGIYNWAGILINAAAAAQQAAAQTPSEDSDEVRAHKLTLALLKTHGKYDSSQDRAVAMVKLMKEL